jgi:hypothetical protein
MLYHARDEIRSACDVDVANTIAISEAERIPRFSTCVSNSLQPATGQGMLASVDQRNRARAPPCCDAPVIALSFMENVTSDMCRK